MSGYWSKKYLKLPHSLGDSEVRNNPPEWTSIADILFRTIACKGAPKHLSGRISAEYICTSVKHKFDRLLRLAGLGGIASVIEASNDIERFLGIQ
jgi:hypothetical protein